MLNATILFFTGSVPVAAILLVSFGAGVVAGLLIALVLAGKRRSAAANS